MDVRRGHDRAVGEELDAGIAAVTGALAVMMEQLDAGLAWSAGLQVIVRADPRDEVSFGGAVKGLVAEADDHAAVVREDAVMAIAREAPARVDRGRPRRAFILAEYHQATPLVGILAEEAGELLTVGRTKDEGLTGIFTGDFGDDARLGPRETAVGGNRLERHQRGLVGAARAAVVEAQGAAILKSDHAAERHHAGEVERRHFFPCLALVLAHDARHPRATALLAKGGGEDPETGFPGRIDNAVNTRAVLVGRESLRQGGIESRPGQATIIAAGHWAGGATVVDAPDREDRLAVRHQQRRRVALVKRRRARGHDHLAFLLSRKIDQRQVRLLFGCDQGG